MEPARIREIETWIFDLDNTLYPPDARLFDQIDRRMTGFIADALGVARGEADGIRTDYWARYGTTLAGLTRHHGIDPAAFLAHAHRIDLSGLRPDPVLARAIEALPGRKIVHTNGARAHADRVLAARGLAEAFDGWYGIDDLEFRSKPEAGAYRTLERLTGHCPARAVMIEDSHPNLAVPREMGMTTIWLDPRGLGARPGHVDHRIGDLTGWIGQVVATARSERSGEVGVSSTTDAGASGPSADDA